VSDMHGLGIIDYFLSKQDDKKLKAKLQANQAAGDANLQAQIDELKARLAAGRFPEIQAEAPPPGLDTTKLALLGGGALVLLLLLKR
jgi:hypothetical protein